MTIKLALSARATGARGAYLLSVFLAGIRCPNGDMTAWPTALATTMSRLIKRYGRSRFYDPEAARYVTLAEPQEWQTRGLAFTVIDVDTNQEITKVLFA